MSDYGALLPPLSDEDYARLKTSIAERGQLVPLEVDEDGAILDGHHRARACQELGITPEKVVAVAGPAVNNATGASQLL